MLPSDCSQKGLLKTELTHNTHKLKSSQLAVCCTRCPWRKVLLSCRVLGQMLHPALAYFMKFSMSPIISLYPATLNNFYFFKHVILFPTSCLYSSCVLYMGCFHWLLTWTAHFFQVSANMLLPFSPSKFFSFHQFLSHHLFYFLHSSYLNVFILYVYSKI